MPIVYDIDEERGIVFAQATGVVGLSDSLTHISEVFTDEKFRPGMHAVFDLTQASLTSFSASDLHRLLGSLEMEPRGIGPGARWAIVAARELDFGVSRMFEALASHLPIEVQVFRDSSAAVAWLAPQREQ